MMQTETQYTALRDHAAEFTGEAAKLLGQFYADLLKNKVPGELAHNLTMEYARQYVFAPRNGKDDPPLKDGQPGDGKKKAK
jgi:hypothetical protein